MKKIALVALVLSACAHRSPVIEPSAEPTLVKLRASLDGPQRTDVEKARDQYRHPIETLSFWGLRDDMTVVELMPGMGWYTAVLAPVLADKGKLVAVVDAPNDSALAVYTKRLEAMPEVFGKVEVRVQKPGIWDLGVGSSADLIVTSRGLHYLKAEELDALFKAVYETLKPGGVFGVEDHRADASDTRSSLDTGYISEEAVIRRVESVTPLKLAARSEVNANSKDTKDYDKGVWALPPTLENGELDKNRYLAIGESDRFTLAFVKPYAP